MKTKKLGLMALALAFGTAAHADEPAQINHEKLDTVRELVNEIESSNDQSEYELKLVQIRTILNSMSKEEIKPLKNSTTICG